MSGTRANAATGGTTANTLKKSIGKIIININSEILELLEEKKKVKDDVTLSKKGVDKENAVRKKKEALEDAIKGLEERPDYVAQEKMEKFVDMIKENIATAGKESEESDTLQIEAVGAQKTATATVETIEQNEKAAEEEMRTLAINLVRSAVLSDNIDSVEEGEIIDDDEDDQLNREFSSIGKYQSDS